MNKKETKEYMKQWYIKNRKRILKQQKEYYENNKKKHLECMKQYRKNNPEKVKECCKKWYKNNSDKVKKYGKKQREENPKYIKQYQKDNRKIIGERHKHWMNRKRKTNLKFNLNCKISIAIGLSLKSNKAGKHWETLVGYTLNDLIKRLKKTFPQYYTWQDFMEGRLHIDHIIPISAFNFTKPEHSDFQKCWALGNLQFLLAKENLVKGNKLIRPFQPALQI